MARDNLMTIPRLEWMEKAACAGVDPLMFFDIEVKSMEETKAIVDLCNGCEVLTECKAYAEHIRPRPENVVIGGVYFRGSNRSDPMRVRKTDKARYDNG